MKVSTFGTGLIAVSLLGVALACGDGGGELSLEAYFQQADEAQNEFSEAGATVLAQYPNVEGDIEDARGAFEFLRDITREFQQALGDIDPPEQVRSFHEDVVAALGAQADARAAVVDQLEGVTTVEEMQAVLEDTAAIDAAQQQLATACAGAQAVADENGIDVDLDCPEEPQ